MNEQTIARLAEQVKTIIDSESPVPAQLIYCKELVRDCLKNKQPLIDVLSKHPNWDEENFRVHFDADYTRNYDFAEAKKALKRLGAYIEDLRCTEHEEISDELYVLGERFFYNYPELFTTPEGILGGIADSVRSYRFSDGELHLSEAHIKEGQKCTRAVMGLLRQYGFNDLRPEYQHNILQTYSEYADAMCPIKIKRHTVLSVNPVDFLLMSEGNSWDSCHRIYEGWGCYSGGCESYAYDSSTMIMYTVGADVDEDSITWAGKVTRQLYFYNGYVLVGSRVYPQRMDGINSVYEEHRLIAEKIMADALGVPNIWKKTEWRDDTPFSSNHYPDYKYNNYPAYVPSVVDTEAEDFSNEIRIGTPNENTICVCCGNHIDYHEYPVCSSCADNRGEEYYCEICREYYYDGDREEHYYDYGGYSVCDYCWEDYFRRCVDCDEYFYSEDMTYIEDVGYVCEDCRNDNYTICDECDNWVRREDTVYLEHLDKTVCQGCFDNYYHQAQEDWLFYPEDDLYHADDGKWYKSDELLVKCSVCGAYHYLGVDADIDSWVCPSCTSKMFDGRHEKCSVCGAYHLKEDMQEIDGLVLCRNCRSYMVTYCQADGQFHLLSNIEYMRVPYSVHFPDTEYHTATKYKYDENEYVADVHGNIRIKSDTIPYGDRYYLKSECTEDGYTGELQPRTSMMVVYDVHMLDGTLRDLYISRNNFSIYFEQRVEDGGLAINSYEREVA